MKTYFWAIMLLVFVMITHKTHSQSLSSERLVELAESLNKKHKGKEYVEGVTVRKIMAFNKTLVYQLNVSEYWEPLDNIKESIIEIWKSSKFAKEFFKNNIDLQYHYFKGNSLYKFISIDSFELSPFQMKIGEVKSIKGHSRSKGVDMQLRVPLGWERKPGEMPNVVLKFVKDLNSFFIIIKENQTFYSRSETVELLNNSEFLQGFVSGLLEDYGGDVDLLEKSIVTVNTYPALMFKTRRKVEKLGVDLEIYNINWWVFYEDKLVVVTGSSLLKSDYIILEPFFLKLTNSIVFPEQFQH